MKMALFLLNTLLVAALLSMTAFNLFDKGKNDQEYTVVKRSEKKAAPAKVKADHTIQTKTGDQESVIVKQNLFNPERNPDAQTGRGGGRIQLTLVGISITENSKGAVILQKGGNTNSFVPPGFPPRPNWQNNNRNQQKQAYQQYIRVGEKLANGYVLTEVSRTGAVLTLNGNRMELKLQEASKNQPQARTNTSRRNTTNNLLQQMQNMQRMQMIQNLQMMRMMRQNQQGQPGPVYIQQRGNRGGQIRR